MDAVELPLPSKVDFGKILISSPDDKVDGGARSGGGGGGEVLRRCGDVDRRHGDVKHHNQNAETSSSYKSRTSLEISTQKSFGLGIKSVNNGKRDYVGDGNVHSLHKQDGKVLPKKTIKLLDGPPCSKRSKLELVQTTRDVEAKGHDLMSHKIVPESTQHTPSEKSRLLKQKRISDGKKIDKKNAKPGVKSKYDCLSLKTGLVNFDSCFLGNNMLGAHGFKSDIRDITNDVENLSLSELLNGSYKYSFLGREKGKKVLHTKDELLASVRKAFSMLSDIDLSHGKGKNLSSDKPSSLVKDPSQTEVCSTDLHCPKDMLSRLILPQGQDLDSVLSAGSESSAAVMPSMTTHGATLPPFPWSHSQAGGYRPSVDSGKHGSTRSSSHWQWQRAGFNPTAVDYEDSSVTIDYLLQEMDTVKSSILDTCGKQSNLCYTESTSGSLGQNIYSGKIGIEHSLQQLHPLEYGDSSDSFQKHECEHYVLNTPQASPKTSLAAEILCDMKRSTEAWSAQGYSNRTIKWPMSLPEKVKARNLSSPFGTAERSSGPRSSDATRTGNNSTKKILDMKNDSAQKGPIKWSVPIEEAASPVRPEKVLTPDMRQTHSNAARHPIQVSSQAHIEKEYENQQKLRKATLTSTLGSGGDWSRERNKRM